MADGDEEIQIGELCAEHLGRVIALGHEDSAPYLVGALHGIRHEYSDAPRARPDDMVTELTLAWRNEHFKISDVSTTPALLRDPLWGTEPFIPPSWSSE